MNLDLTDEQRARDLLSNDYEAVVRSVNAGKPIVLDGTSRYGRDLKAFAGLG